LVFVSSKIPSAGKGRASRLFLETRNSPMSTRVCERLGSQFSYVVSVIHLP
jgi:hypothetical protein